MTSLVPSPCIKPHDLTSMAGSTQHWHRNGRAVSGTKVLKTELYREPRAGIKRRPTDGNQGALTRLCREPRAGIAWRRSRALAERTEIAWGHCEVGWNSR